MAGPGQNVRLGDKKRGFSWDPRDYPRNTLILIGGVALLGVFFVVAIIWLLSSPEESALVDGCVDSSGCPAGQFCAAGGCVVLLPNEYPNVWAEDIALQLDSDPETPDWELPSSFGERLPPTKTCPADEKDVEPFDEGKMFHKHITRVFDLGQTPAVVYRYLRTQGSIWVGTLRFWLDDQVEPAPETVCTSAEIVAFSRGLGNHHGSKKAYIDGELARSVPADVDAMGAVSYQIPLTKPDPEGMRILSFDLPPVILPDQRFFTVVGVPLGAEVPSIGGAKPTLQRLLTGYIAYYWEHTKTKSHVDFRFRSPENKGEVLDISEVRP